MIARDVPDLVGKALCGGLILFLLWLASDSPTGRQAFGDEWAIAMTGMKALLIGFAILFFCNLLFVAPYQLWQERLSGDSDGSPAKTQEAIAYSLERARQQAIKDARDEEEMRQADYYMEMLEAQEHTEDETRHRLIGQCRDLAHRYTVEESGDTFRRFLESSRVYPDIRKHLGHIFMSRLNAVRTTYSQADGGKYETLVQEFLDELDRLEDLWGL